MLHKKKVFDYKNFLFVFKINPVLFWKDSNSITIFSICWMILCMLLSYPFNLSLIFILKTYCKSFPHVSKKTGF